MATTNNDRVVLEIDQGIATVTLNRPDKHNGLDMAMFDAIVAVTRQLKKDRSVRAIILKGAGEAFCSGLDVAKVSKNPVNFLKLLVKPGRKISNLAQDVGYLWRDVPAPVIAVPHGYCFDGGFQIALGADFRFSTSDCEFSIMETKWGLIPDMSLTVTLGELISIDLAKELTMTARRFNGAEAKEMGLVQSIVSKDSLLNEALETAQLIAQKGPAAITSLNSVVQDGLHKGFDQGCAAETEVFASLFEKNGQAHEGMQAFLEKRQPNWNINN